MNIQEAQYYHSKRRCKERYGLDLSKENWRSLSNLIKNKHSLTTEISYHKGRRKTFKILLN